MFLAVLRLIFVLKREIAPPPNKNSPPKDREMRSRSGCQLTEKRSEFRWRPFFFWDHLILDRKTIWISLNPIEIKWKFGSSSFTVESNFKKSPPPLCKILATWLIISLLIKHFTYCIFISLKFFLCFYINSDSTLTQNQVLTLKLTPNLTLILSLKKANEKCVDDNLSFPFIFKSKLSGEIVTRFLLMASFGAVMVMMVVYRALIEQFRKLVSFNQQEHNLFS